MIATFKCSRYEQIYVIEIKENYFAYIAYTKTRNKYILTRKGTLLGHQTFLKGVQVW